MSDSGAGKSTSEKAGMGRLRELISEFEEARGHFESSQRELLLGFRSIVDVLIRFTEEAGEDSVRRNVLVMIRAGIEYLIGKTPPGEPARADEAMIEAYTAILDVLAEEEASIRKRKEPRVGDREKLEAIEAIRRVLVIERDKAGERARDPHARARIRKVQVE